MAFLRPGSDVNRRSRLKSVVSRRSRRSSKSLRSTNDDDDYLGAEEEEILSCFLDDSADNNFLVDRVLYDSLLIDKREHQRDFKESQEVSSVQIQALAEQSEHDHFIDVDSELVQFEPKNARSRRSKEQDHESDAGDASRHSFETIFQENHVQPTETKMGKINDFVDMALSREGPDSSDIGLCRAEPIMHHRDRNVTTPLDQQPKSKKFKTHVNFGCFDILIGIVTIIIFFVDIGTDIELAVHYLKKEMWMYGGVTLGLIIWPSLITSALGLHWYIIDYRKEKKIVEKIKQARKKAFVTPGYVWFIRFFFTLLQIGPVLRIGAYLYYGQMSRNKKLPEKQRNRYYHFMIYEDVDSCLLRLFESFLEAAPQLSWQLYIAMVLKENKDVVGTTFRAIALLSSWGSLAISLVSYHRSLRNSNDDKAKMAWSSVPFYFLWRASEIGGRVLCIATFASTFQLWVFGPVLFHWMVMSIWLIAQKTNFYKNKCQEKAFNIICGYVMIFCFLNLREGVTRFRFLLFYSIVYVENFFMLGFWFRFSPDLGAWFHLWGFIVILILFVFHIFFQLLYYGFFHPTKKIKFCLPCDPYIVYESLCYDLESIPTLAESQPPVNIVIPRDLIPNHNHNKDSPLVINYTHDKRQEVPLNNYSNNSSNNVELKVTTV